MENLPAFNNISNQKLEEIATNFRNNGQIEKAVSAYQTLMERFDAAGDKNHAAGMQHMIGVAYKIANQTEQSLLALDKAKLRYTEADDQVGVARVLRDEGITYQYAQNYEDALPRLRESVALLEELDAAELGISQAKLGNLYFLMNDYDLAESWLQKGLDTLEKADHPFYLATAQLHFADFYIETDRQDTGLLLINSAEQLLQDNGGEQANLRRFAQIEALRALAYLHNNDTDTATIHKQRWQHYLSLLDEKSASYLRDHPASRALLDL